VEEFISCGVWPLAAGINFEHVKVDLTLVWKLKVPLPRFPLFREDEEHDTHFLARVEPEAKNIVGSYTGTEHQACITSLPNNGRLNHVLELAGVAYGPRSVPVSPVVLKKRKAEAAVKVLAKRPKVPEKKDAEPAKVSGARMSGGSKRPSSTDILPVRAAKLSKGTIPRTIASAAVACITFEMHGSENLLSTSGSKAGGRGPGCKTVPGSRKAIPSIKKHIIPAIGALATVSSEGTQESSPHDQVLEVQSKAGPHSQSLEPQAQSLATSGLRSIPEVSLPIAMSVGAAGASTGYLRSLKTVCILLKRGF
jgi:hypothetical protein